MNRVVLSLGSNVAKEHNLPAAVVLLRQISQVTAVAPVYETAPTGLLAQPNFFNTAVLLHTPLTPAQIKDDLIAAIESALQRVRQTDKNAPRTIDVDLALFNDDVLDYVAQDGRSRHLPTPTSSASPTSPCPLPTCCPTCPTPKQASRWPPSPPACAPPCQRRLSGFARTLRFSTLRTNFLHSEQEYCQRLRRFLSSISNL
jgi:2-amino-4-hydroxy-6-hydroxymethyldihydropteridine diphosphokinase